MAALGSKYFKNSRAAYFQLPGSVADPSKLADKDEEDGEDKVPTATTVAATMSGDESSSSPVSSETPPKVVETSPAVATTGAKEEERSEG